jgi:2-(1,2-epoxy-1,2-dihydrophenyl)acetyl-CoA isomerase
MESLVLLKEEKSIFTLMLNRPTRHNSLIPELIEDFLVKLEVVAGSPEARAVILEARGRSFSTGGDIFGFYQNRQDLAAYSARLVGLLNDAILGLLRLPLPVIAAVQGIVTGGSLGFVLAADTILLTPKASFTPYYGHLGFSPDGGWTALLPAIIGLKRVNEIIMYNRTITAEEALDWGLATKIIPQADLQDEAKKYAREVSSMTGGSIRSSKLLLNSSLGDIESRLRMEQERFVLQIQSDQARQGIERFLNIPDG